MILRKSLFETTVSIVLPVYNEAGVLSRLVNGLRDALREVRCDAEIVFVDDGSTDGSADLLDALAESDPQIRVVHFSRNFGHQAAVQAGLLHASGDVLVLMDSDLQDDPAAIPRMLEMWQQGFDVVYAVRTERKESYLKRALFTSFYRLLNAISQTPMPLDAGNFGLIDRKVAERIAHLIDRDRFFPGLRRWVGFRQTGIPVERLARYDDNPRVSLRGLFRLAKTAIFGFSTFPLTVFYWIAGLSAGAFLAVATFALYHRLISGLAIPGWTSITLVAAFFGAINALGIAILGEYVARIYDQVRSRPQFIVARKLNFSGDRVCTIGASLNWSIDPWADASRFEPTARISGDASQRD